jgi:hypothetical protein
MSAQGQKMNMQLDTSEVQEAVTEYLRKRGVVVEDARQVRLEIVDRSGARMNIVGCSAVVVAGNAKLRQEPYQ